MNEIDEFNQTSLRNRFEILGNLEECVIKDHSERNNKDMINREREFSIRAKKNSKKEVRENKNKAVDENNMTRNMIVRKVSKPSKQGKLSQEAKIKDKLKVIYFNARSLVNKHEELELYMREENVDIVGITETWLNESIIDSEVNISGYTLFRKDRKSESKTRGGGVALYVRNNINVILNNEISNDIFPEILFCDLECKECKTLVGVCYRPPDTSRESSEGLYELIKKASEQECILMGDFNYSELRWDHSSNLNDEHPFVKCINDSFLSQLVDEPTRGKNFLDLILCTDETTVEDLKVGEPFETSDHSIIRFNFVSRPIKCERVDNKFNFFKADYNQIRDFVKSRNWDRLTSLTSVEEQWAEIKKELVLIRDKFIPKYRRCKARCKWVNKNVTKCRRAKKKAWKKYVESGKDNTLYEVYKTKLNKSVKMNNKAKNEFETRLAQNAKADSKSFYSYIRSKQRCKVKVGPLRTSNGNAIVSDAEVAESLNEYFSSVFTVENISSIPSPENLFESEIGNELSNVIIDERVVFNKLSELNINKSPGPDNIHPKLLYELREELAKPLTQLYKLSMESSVIPQDWKDANVAPLFKKGARDKCENYRPVSLTCIICKILESIIKDKIIDHLDKYKLIRDSQHGFTKGRSCLTNLLDFLELVTKWLDDGKPVDLVYLDFAKAFDKVPFMRLFKKLEAHGINDRVIEWIKSWLGNRRQSVSISGTCSGWRNVTSGVPQGSVLGPVLFLIYINDLDNNLISKLNKFADDSKVGKVVSSTEDIEDLQRDLDKLHCWSEQWQMKFNVDKCSVIHLGNHNLNGSYNIGDKQLKTSSCERDLGVILDSSLKFSEHCSQVVKQANSTLGLIRRNIKCKSKDVIVKLYKALVRPKLDYCVQAWRPHLKKDIYSLEQVQRRATRMISECKGKDYESRLRETGLTSLQARRNRGDLIQVFKLVKGIDKLDYRTFFQFAESNRTRGHRYKLVKKRCSLNLRKNFFSQRVVDIWNKLPESVVEATTVNAFKNRLDKVVKGGSKILED